MAQARQADFDQLVKEMVAEGTRVEDALSEAKEILTDSGFDLSSLYLCETAKELSEKEQVEKNFRTLEDTAALKNTIVNASFCIQGLRQNIQGDCTSKVSIGTLKLAESRRCLHTIISILEQTLEVNEDEKGKLKAGNEESDEEEEDEDENRIIQKLTLLTFAVLLLTKASSTYLKFQEHITLTDAQVTFLCKVFDEDVGEAR